MGDNINDEADKLQATEDDPVFSNLLSRTRKIIERKHVSVKYSGEYLHWMAESLAKSFDRRRRPSFSLINELIPVLEEASELAKKGEEKAACDVLLCGFGLKPVTGRRPAASILEVVNKMDQLIISKQVNGMAAAAEIVAKEFNIGFSTAKRYWDTYKEHIKNYHE